MRYRRTTTPEERALYKRWRKRIADDSRMFRKMTGSWPRKIWIKQSLAQAALKVLQGIEPGISLKEALSDQRR